MPDGVRKPAGDAFEVGEDPVAALLAQLVEAFLAPKSALCLDPDQVPGSAS
jgi:hypothetical protein